MIITRDSLQTILHCVAIQGNKTQDSYYQELWDAINKTVESAHHSQIYWEINPR
jgi:hypothetical protein